jgi:hypothetical protein
VYTRLTKGFTTAQFELRSKGGDVLQSLSLASASETEFLGSATLPTAPFLRYVTGSDSAGKPYQRLIAGLVQSQSVNMTSPPPTLVPAGGTGRLSFSVQNLGSDETFTVTASVKQGTLLSLTPGNLTLAAGASAAVVVLVGIPASATDGVVSTVTVNVAGSSGATNYAQVSLEKRSRAAVCNFKKVFE